MGGGGNMFNPIGSLLSGGGGDRRADISYETGRRDQMNALGQEELGRYQHYRDTGEITASQQAELDVQGAASKARTRQAYGSAGVGDSTMATSAESTVDMNTLIQKGNFNQMDMAQAYNAAMRDFGMSDTMQLNIMQLHRDERIENLTATSMLMGVMGGLAGGGKTQAPQEQPYQSDQPQSTSFDTAGSSGGEYMTNTGETSSPPTQSYMDNTGATGVSTESGSSLQFIQ